MFSIDSISEESDTNQPEEHYLPKVKHFKQVKSEPPVTFEISHANSSNGDDSYEGFKRSNPELLKLDWQNDTSERECKHLILLKIPLLILSFYINVV